ncbi:MAG: 3D-(3,5/4)-trihydroxycyclohexane-1,2-dione acylhydrolase (decyclizing), partial [Clostridia bacterium]|nr:3D-(3,5/4)-trihydroxycyclohexane-1,2-dione acylhydrolase (decyclizing) [Clostridia bacterium]
TPFVRGVFMLPGHGNVVGIGQALAQEAGRLEIYQGKNEQGMAHVAVAFAKQMKRKQIFAVTSSVGPGAANMITAAATATANNIPVLLLPGDVYACRQPDPVLQQIEQINDMSLSTNDAYRPVCRYWDRVSRPDQLMSAMLNAMRTLTDPANTGAVCVAMPQDVEGEAYDYPATFLEKRVWRLERRPATEFAMEKAAEVIRTAKKPILVCGGGVRYSEAHDEFMDFARTFNIPFGETQAGKSAIEWTDPLNLGGIGVTGCLAANVIAKEADVVIGVGTRYTDFTTSSKWLFRQDAKFVNINVSEFQAYKLDATPVIADAKEALPALKKALSGYMSGYTDEIKAAKDKWQAELDRLDGLEFDEGSIPNVIDLNAESAEKFASDIGSRFTQTMALGAINRLIAPDSVVIGSSGSLPGCMQRMWRPSHRDTYNMEYGYSCMGYEINGALGVKLAIGEREVYAMVGDGSFTMLHSEMLTAIQERLKINICLFDNASFGCINNLQVGQGNDSLCTELRYRRSQSGKLDGDFLNVSYAKIAEGYGAVGYTIKTLEELERALEDSKNVTDRPVLFDIKVLPKSMTDGYLSWWRVGTPEVSENPRNRECWKEHLEHVGNARKY